MADGYGMDYRPLGTRFGGGGNSYRLAQLLSRQNYNNGTNAGGMANVLQQALMGMAIKGENDQAAKTEADTTAANNAMVQGMTAKPWVNPDTGQAQGTAGGYEGGLAALSNLGGDNAPAGKLSQALLMNKVGQDEARRVEQAKLNAPREMAPGTTLYDPQSRAPIFTAPREDKPLSNLGQLAADFKAGRISSADYNAAVAKATKIEGQGNGPFAGTAMDAQATNILLQGDPSSPAYQAAWAHLSAPKVTIDPNTMAQTIVQPNMSWARPPIGQGAPTGSPQPMQPPASGPIQSPASAAPVAAPVPGTPVSRSMGGVTVTATPGQKLPDDTQSMAGGFASRMENAEGTLTKLSAAGENGIVGPAEYIAGSVNRDLGNAAASSTRQQYRQAQEDWVRAKLRKESGAVIGPNEMLDEIRTYFPQPGDQPEVIAQKAYARKVAFNAMTKVAGPAYKSAAPKITNNPGGKLVANGDGSYNWVPN